jgi:hypothetical protein
LHAAQAAGEDTPVLGWLVPAEQLRQAAGEVAESRGWKVPSGQGTAKAASQKEPAVQAWQALLPSNATYVPGPQAMQSSWLVDP